MFGLINKPSAYSTQNEQKSKARFLKECNSSKVGNRLLKPDLDPVKPGLSPVSYTHLTLPTIYSV